MFIIDLLIFGIKKCLLIKLMVSFCIANKLKCLHEKFYSTFKIFFFFMAKVSI